MRGRNRGVAAHAPCLAPLRTHHTGGPPRARAHRHVPAATDAFRWDGGLTFFAREWKVFGLGSATRQEAKPPSHARMVLRRSRKEVVLAGFAAEAQAPMVVTNKAELSATV